MFVQKQGHYVKLKENLVNTVEFTFLKIGQNIYLNDI